MKLISRGFKKVHSSQIHYRESGNGEVLLLLHEMPLSSLVFEPLLPFFEGDIHAIAPDLPGFGSSESPEKKLSIPDYAKIMWDFIGEFGYKKINILGVHGGASIAIEMADKQPERVGKLILNGIPLFSETERIALHNSLMKLNIKEDGSHFREWWHYFRDKWGKEIPMEIIHRSVMQVMEAGPSYEFGYQAAFDYDPSLALTRLKQQILLQVAAGDILASKNSLAMKLISGPCKEEVIQVSGHLSQRMPREMGSSVLNFLNE